jgi:septal ring factor EnvC (AmiA/AmiB activator)
LLGAAPGALAQDRKELDVLRSRIERLRADLAGAEENRGEVREQLRESESAISESGRTLRMLAGQRAAVQRDIAALQAQQQAARAALAARERQLGNLLAATYRTGESVQLRVLLYGSDPLQAARDLHYLRQLAKAHAAFLDTTRAELEALRSLEARTREKTVELEGTEAVQRAEHARQLEQRAARRRVLERVSAQIRLQKRQVQTLARDEARLSRLVQGLARVVAAAPPRAGRTDVLPEAGGGSFPAMKGRLRLPVRGELAARFGAPRVSGGPSWKGLFIRTAAGEEVRAVARGRVVFADWMRGLGNLLVVDHGQGYLTIYGNNESVYKTLGDEVRAGDVVASVGASGGTQETGLYFEIRHEGRAFDPLTWVTLR